MLHDPLERRRVRRFLIDAYLTVVGHYFGIVAEGDVFVCIENLVGYFMHALNPSAFHFDTLFRFLKH